MKSILVMVIFHLASSAAAQQLKATVLSSATGGLTPTFSCSIEVNGDADGLRVGDLVELLRRNPAASPLLIDLVKAPLSASSSAPLRDQILYFGLTLALSRSKPVESCGSASITKMELNSSCEKMTELANLLNANVFDKSAADRQQMLERTVADCQRLQRPGAIPREQIPTGTAPANAPGEKSKSKTGI